MNFNIDNERPDMQLAHDRAVGTIRDNDRYKVIDQRIAAENSHRWGSKDTSPLSAIIGKLVGDGGGRYLDAKSSIHYDHEINEIVDDIALDARLIPDGWDEPITEQEQIEVILQDKGDQVEIMVLLHP
jgi:hypothetical protein